MRPEHFDILGIFAFVYIIFISLWVLFAKNQPSDWFFYVLLIIGIAGFVIDVTIVYKYFLRRKNEKS